MRLLQSRYQNPWKQAIVCILLNQTTGTQVRRVLPELFRAYPSPRKMEMAGPELEEILRPLGLWRRRGRALRMFSADYRSGTPVQMCFGIGPYARDSHRIFALGDLSVEPEDKELRRYVEHHRQKEGHA